MDDNEDRLPLSVLLLLFLHSRRDLDFFDDFILNLVLSLGDGLLLAPSAVETSLLNESDSLSVFALPSKGEGLVEPDTTVLRYSCWPLMGGNGVADSSKMRTEC